MTSLPPPSCAHRELCFGQGGFYIRCVDCGTRWVAFRSVPGDPHQPDPTQSVGLGEADMRVKPGGEVA